MSPTQSENLPERTSPADAPRQPLSERLWRGTPHPDAHRERMMEGASVEEPQRHPDALEDGSLSKSTAKRVDALRLEQGEDGPSWRYAVVSALEYMRAGDSEQAQDMLESALRMDATPPTPKLLAQGEDYSACCDTPAYCSSVRRCTAKDEVTQPPHQDRGEVEQRARELLQDAVYTTAHTGAPYVGVEVAVRAITAALTEAKQQGPGEAVLTTAERSVIDTLLGLAFAAWGLADNSEDGGGGITVDRKDFGLLSRYLDALDALPDDRPGYTMAEAAKARWALRRVLAAPQVEAKRQTGDDLLRAIADNYWKVDPFDMPMPGGDDADVGWRISEYLRHGQRVVVECYRDDLPGAIREAIAAAAKPSGERHA